MKPDCVMTQHYRDKDGYGVGREESTATGQSCASSSATRWIC